ncbi:MAG: hypothetical protein COW01_09210 [Bdellovibrionales bacterium CG12_big_fil_rev_8_21_14_0_65_38_15]|nr:MAG: hypothetical protein COW79_09215 [Bdellovibrionales bacterium CG22_combo_CG10-13_8_21_14_all_38_13]PIQ54707.1 MAG: hypothetical protein COW01_09210 [Bdellovibrionales bacterium CG12_big_fil_rev_8_21_14_0_65_38_15]PIR30855.1 MAG: hypothetical protein COV38_03395 [Bdellovibrionales bacterium CG11_big_fil_rev_8_21_14_0_20_38_13]
MSIRASRSSFYFFTTIIIASVISLVAGSYWFWTQGPSQGSKLAEVFEAGLVMDRLLDEKNINELNELVSNDQVRLATKKLSTIESDTKMIERLTNNDSAEEFLEASTKLRSQMNSLIEYPELSSIFSVLTNKMSAFESFVVQSQWRTLSRLSKKVGARLEPAQAKSPGAFSYAKLKQTVEGTTDDIEMMKKVTTNSVLSSVDKNTILNRLITMESELDMLNRYVKSLAEFNPIFNNYKKTWQQWTKAASPNLAKLRLDQENVSQWLLYGVVLVITFLMIGLFVGVGISQSEYKTNLKAWEKDSVEMLRDRLLPTDGKESKEWSKEFSLEFSKYREYFHKRMSFGTIFQEATPFSAFLLDSNLGVVWANDLFSKCWNIEAQQDNEANLTWDYLSGFTNLGEDDPVILALRQGIAGIYQIQIKAFGLEETAPYEMYVSPVDYAGQKRVMIFLYPLHTVEESLAEQTKAVVGPAIKALEAISAREFEGEVLEKLESQFSSAGIADLYSQFEKFNSHVGDRIESLEGEINYLRQELIKAKSQVSLHEASLKQNINLVEQTVQSFDQVKTNIISSVDYRYEVEKLYADTVATAKILFKEEDDLLTDSMSVYDLLGENQKATASVSKIREQLKDIKRDFDDTRSRLNQSIDQALVFSKRDQDGGVLEAPLHKIRGEVKAFDLTQANLTKTLKSLDVSLSKMEMILDDHRPPSFEKLKLNFSDARARIESDMFKVSKLAREGEVIDEKVITSLKKLFSDFKHSRQHSFVSLNSTSEKMKSNQGESLQQQV